jgi:hypothetical protein
MNFDVPSRSADVGQAAVRIEERPLRGDMRFGDGPQEGGTPLFVTGAQVLQEA